jgi:glycosyltransferase involved in cell wall biosynthesis
MRILFLTQFYPPESGAAQNRLSDMARRLSAAGHEVEVLTAMPNYPKGAVFHGYQHRAVLEERRDGVRVIRTWIFASPNSGFVHRLLTYFSFMVSSLIFGVRRVARPDVVAVELPPLFLGLSGYAISRLRRAKLVLNVSDLWPESAVAMGILRNRFLIDLSTRLEEFLYRRSDLVTGQTEGIVQSVRSRFPKKRLGLITNGVALAAFHGPSRSEEVRKLRLEFGFGECFVVGYAGLHGHAQGLETVLRAAQLLESVPEVIFAFVGEGPLKPDLIAFAGSARNVRFIEAQPSSRMREVLSTFDVAVIPLRRLALFRGALPSKMFEAMAAGLPLLVSIDGEARALVERSQAGIFVEPEDAQGLAQAILTLRRDPDRCRRMGENGRRHVAAHYDRASIAKQFEKLLLETVEDEAPDAELRNGDGVEGGAREACEAKQMPEAHSKTGSS